VAGDGERADRPHADGVAVGGGLGDEIEAEGQCAARPVVDHDGRVQDRTELRRQDARHRVGRAARRLRHDEADRPVWVLGARANRQRDGE
jgi:hypothetical protein